MKTRFFILVSLVGLVSCGTNESLIQPSLKPRPRVELPQTKPAEPTKQSEAPAPAPFEGQDYLIVGKWRKECAPSQDKWVREEVNFANDRLLVTTETFSESGCTGRADTATLDLVFEDGWDPIVHQVGGVFTKAFKGIFRDEKSPEEFVDYDTVASLAMENGRRVLYLRWTTGKSVELDTARDRFIGLDK